MDDGRLEGLIVALDAAHKKRDPEVLRLDGEVAAELRRRGARRHWVASRRLSARLNDDPTNANDLKVYFG